MNMRTLNYQNLMPTNQALEIVRKRLRHVDLSSCEINKHADVVDVVTFHNITENDFNNICKFTGGSGHYVPEQKKGVALNFGLFH